MSRVGGANERARCGARRDGAPKTAAHRIRRQREHGVLVLLMRGWLCRKGVRVSQAPAAAAGGRWCAGRADRPHFPSLFLLSVLAHAASIVSFPFFFHPLTNGDVLRPRRGQAPDHHGGDAHAAAVHPGRQGGGPAGRGAWQRGARRLHAVRGRQAGDRPGHAHPLRQPACRRQAGGEDRAGTGAGRAGQRWWRWWQWR